MSQDDAEEILTKYKTIAIVGLSDNPSRDSHKVAEYLKKHGFKIVPINPFISGVLGEISYKSLLDVPVEAQKTIEVIDIFRPAQEAPSIVEQVIQLKKIHGKPYVVWMQLGIINEQAAESAHKAGLMVVMDKCMMREHKRLFTGKTDLESKENHG